MKVFCFTLLSLVATVVGATDVGAQEWPNRPIRAIVPVAAGSTTDIVPRIVFEQLSEQLGQNVVVENRPGAGTTIGSNFVAKAEPDGYTLLVNSSAHAISKALYSNLGYDAAHDFAGVISLGTSPNVLVVASGKNFKTVDDLVAAGKAKPGSLTFSSVGIGTSTHLSAERFLASAGVRAVHVPFKGGAQAMQEVMAGRIDFFFGPIGLVLPNIQDGKLIALVVNSDKRANSLPNVPTTAEAGFKDAEFPIWFGVFLPARTPRAIVEKLHREIFQALESEKVHSKLAAMGVDPMPMTPAEFDAFVQRQIAANAALVKAIGVKTN